MTEHEGHGRLHTDPWPSALPDVVVGQADAIRLDPQTTSVDSHGGSGQSEWMTSGPPICSTTAAFIASPSVSPGTPGSQTSITRRALDTYGLRRWLLPGARGRNGRSTTRAGAFSASAKQLHRPGPRGDAPRPRSVVRRGNVTADGRSNHAKEAFESLCTGVVLPITDDSADPRVRPQTFAQVRPRGCRMLSRDVPPARRSQLPTVSDRRRGQLASAAIASVEC